MRTPVELGVDVVSEATLRALQLEGQRDEPLLHAVVDAALDAPALLVGRGDDPRARLLHLLELRAHLAVQARVLGREPRGGRNRLDELGLRQQRRIVDEDGERLAVLLEPRHGTRGTLVRDVDRTPLAVGAFVNLVLNGLALQRASGDEPVPVELVVRLLEDAIGGRAPSRTPSRTRS